MSGCPVPGCSASLRSGYLMCRPHWYQVPAQLRRAVHATWREVQRAETVELKRDAIAKYRDTRDQAITAAAEKRRGDAPLLP